MNSVDTFKCARLKKTFTVGRCIRNQKDALAFWGPDAARYQSCPCDQGIKIRQQMEGTMAVKAICRNCGRKMSIMQDRMCGGCCGRSKAREDFMGKEPKSHGNYRPRKPKMEDKPKTDPESGAIAHAGVQDSTGKVEGKRKIDPFPPSTNEEETSASRLEPTQHPVVSAVSLEIDFTDDDRVLFEALQALSRKYRRSPAHQLLWLLEHELTNERLVVSDKGVAHGINAEVA